MDETTLPAFERGAEWVRADFHLHTLKDPGASRKEFRAEWKDREGGFAAAWVEKLKKEGVKVAVVTNHNVFNYHEYKQLKKQGAKQKILVLPGVELGVKEGGTGVHTLIVFNPEDWLPNGTQEDKINRFLQGQFTGEPTESTRTLHDLCECLTALEKFGCDYFVIFAHVQSENGLFKEVKEGSLRDLIANCDTQWRGRVLGLQRLKDADELKRRWPNEVPLPALVEGSDPKTFAEVGASDHACFIKIGEMSYHSVKFALHDWQQRVTASPPDVTAVPRLQRISFEGGFLAGQSFAFSDELTCLIGSRGGGKSSVIECLRYALGLDAGKLDEEYKDKLVAAFLANGGAVKVEGITKNGDAFEISRPYGYEPVVSLNGEQTRLKPMDVMPGTLYFGQKDLGHRHEDFENDFFRKLTEQNQTRQRHLEEEKISAVKRAVEEWLSVQRANEKEKEYQDEAARLKDQLEVYKKKGVEEQLKRLTAFDSDKQNVQDFLRQLRALREVLSLEPEAWLDADTVWPELKSKELEAIGDQLLATKAEYTLVQQEHDALLRRLDRVIEKVEGTFEEVKTKERELQNQFAELQREIDIPGLNLNKFRADKTRYEQLQKLLKAAANRSEMTQRAIEKVGMAASDLHALWRKWHLEEDEVIQKKNKLLPETVHLSVEFEGNKAAFREFLKARFSGSGFRANSIDRLVENFSNGFILFQKREEVAKLLAGTADKDKFFAVLKEQMAAFLTFRVPSKRTIVFKNTPIQELSLGQRATALLQLLMALDDHPVFLLDQPEDDLDNETIFDFVVEPLLKQKKRVQFVIATHNPNIPVLGDAELVHSCKEEELKKYTHRSGSLDSRETRQSIVTIMEGGRQAFEKRQNIYNQWTNSL